MDAEYYERIILAMSIVSLFPIWAMARLWGEAIKNSSGSFRGITKVMLMMFAITISSAMLIMPLFSFVTTGRVLP